MVNTNMQEKPYQKRAIYFITLKGKTHNMTTQSQTTRNANTQLSHRENNGFCH